ncbi:MAG TPA: hypothetical protein VHD83_20395 [Puia sp.]|nr:hypothetical protein [Puia sp.]
MKKVFLLISGILYALLSYGSTTLTGWEVISIVMMVYFLLEFLDDLGKKIAIFHLTILITVFMCLLMPILFYHVFPKGNFYARVWAKYMPVDSETYFSFMVPATLTMILGLRLPLGKLKLNKDPKAYMERVREHLRTNPKQGTYLIVIGVVSGFLNPFVPSVLSQILYFLEHLTYVGVFYVLYSPTKGKRLYIILVIFLMLSQTMITGMFGEFVFILALSLVLIMLGKGFRFYWKLLVAVAGITLILLIQSVKAEYRMYSWRGGGASPAYFLSLIGDRIANPSSIWEEKRIFAMSVRMNQGWLIAMTMYKVPNKLPFANGETIWQSVAASFVPRFMWPDKPEAGGRFNLRRFWGYKTYSSVSMNIGPMGEAYGNFGVTGGIIYMFFYGLFFNWMLFMILKLSEKTPTLVLWIPFLFLYTINIETDLVTTMNSLLKGVFFVWLIYTAFRRFFHMQL